LSGNGEAILHLFAYQNLFYDFRQPNNITLKKMLQRKA